MNLPLSAAGDSTHGQIAGGAAADKDVQGSRSQSMAKTEEVEQLRRRARRRLVGAAAIVLFLVIVPPMLMDLEPKPVSSNLSVEIPAPPAVRTDPVVRSTPTAPISRGQPEEPAGSDAGSSSDDTAATEAPSSLARNDVPGGTAPSATRGEPEAPATPEPPPITVMSATTASGAPTQGSPGGGGASATGESGSPSGLRAAARDTIATAPSAPPSSRGSEGASRSAGAESYFVPLGTFAERENGQQLVRRAGQLGVRAYSEEVMTASGTRTRVRAGPFSSRESAERARSALKNAGIETLTVRRAEKRG